MAKEKKQPAKEQAAGEEQEKKTAGEEKSEKKKPAKEKAEAKKDDKKKEDKKDDKKEEKKKKPTKAERESGKKHKKKSWWQRVKQWFHDLRVEFGNVTWPTRNTVLVNTGVVLGVIAIGSTLIGLMDLGFLKLMEFLLSLGQS